MDSRNPARVWLGRRQVYYGWVLVVICFLSTTLTFGTVYSYPVLLEPILNEFGESHANTSLVFAIQTLVSFGGAAALGFTIDRYGIRQLLVLAAVLVAAGMAIAARAESLATIIVGYGVIAGAGIGIVYVVAYIIPPRWFDRRRGLAMGIAVSGTGVGVLVGPPAVNVISQQFGWRTTYLVLGGVFVSVIALAVLLVAERPREFDAGVSDEFDELAALDATSPVPSLRDQIVAIGGIIRGRLFISIFLVLLLAFVPHYAVLVYLVEYAQSVGITRQAGVIAFSAIGAANIVAKVLAGGVSDAIGIVETLGGCIALICIGAVLLVAFPTPVTLVVFAGIFGLGSGGIAALLSPLLANLFGTEDLGTLFGVVSANFAIAGTIVPFVVGLSFDILGSYRLPFLAAAGVGAVALIVLFAVRLTVRQESTAAVTT